MYASGNVEEHFHGNSRYHIGDGNGVLTVWAGEDKKIVYGSAAWLRVEEALEDDLGATEGRLLYPR